MARQKLGKKKHKKCEEITGKKYDGCLVRGGQTHYTAICVYYDEKDIQHHDYVNYKTGEFKEDHP